MTSQPPPEATRPAPGAPAAPAAPGAATTAAAEPVALHLDVDHPEGAHRARVFARPPRPGDDTSSPRASAAAVPGVGAEAEAEDAEAWAMERVAWASKQ